MSIKIVTDSTADLPPHIASDLGITVVPAYLHFGDDTYRDRLDISDDQFYQRLLSTSVHPITEPPKPQDFADVYRRLSQEADGIISIHISSKLSATYNAAMRGAELAEDECPIEVVDSRLVTMGLGLLTMSAASAANSGGNIPQVVEKIMKTIPHIRIFGLFDTLKYLALGGRIGKLKALLASVLNVKPILTMRDGEIEPAGQVRHRAEGIERLLNFVKATMVIQDMAIVYSTTPDEAATLAERIDSIFSKDRITMARLGPVLGVHGGPGILFVVLREED